MTPPAELLPLLGSAFLLGLAGSLHCVGMCGAFALISRGRPAWHLGRLATYASLGAAAGLAGEGLSEALAGLPGWAAVSALVLLLVGVGWTVARASAKGQPPAFVRPLAGLLRRTGGALAQGSEVGPFRRAASLLLLGAAGSLLPCGLVYAALVPAAASAAPGTGVLVGLSFGLGTAPALTAAALGLRSLTRRLPSAGVRRAAVALAVVAGLAVVALRAPSLTAQAGEPAPPHCPVHDAP